MAVKSKNSEGVDPYLQCSMERMTDIQIEKMHE